MHESTNGQDVYYRMMEASFPVEFSVTPMLEHGVIIGSVLSFRDIGQRYALDRMKDDSSPRSATSCARRSPRSGAP